MQLVNLTSQDITIGSIENGEFQVSRIIPPHGKVAQVVAQRVEAGFINSLPVQEIRHLGIEGLPSEENSTVKYIVSRSVAQLIRGRNDVFCPDLEKAFCKGTQILGVPGFVRYQSDELNLSKEERISVAFKKFVNISSGPVTFSWPAENTIQSALTLGKTHMTARVNFVRIPDEAIDGILCWKVKFASIENLPPKEPGTIYIASLVVAQYSDRDDVYTADIEKGFRVDDEIVAVPGIVYHRLYTPLK